MTNYDIDKTKSFIEFAKACVEFDKRPKNEKMYLATNYGYFEDSGKWFINKTIAKNSFYESDLLALYCLGADTNNQERIREMLKLSTNAFALDDDLEARAKGQIMNNTNISDTWFIKQNLWFLKKYKLKDYGTPHNWAVFCVKLSELESEGGVEVVARLLSFFDFREENEILKTIAEIKTTLREIPVEKLEEVAKNVSIEIEMPLFPEKEGEVENDN